MLASMNPERKNPKPTEGLTPRTPGDILPPSLQKYTPGVKDYMRIAAEQNVNPDIEIALAVYAVYMYGTDIPKSGGQHASKLMSPKDISRILNISEKDVKKHMLLIETIEGIKAWEHFETDIKKLTERLGKNLKEETHKLHTKGLTNDQIADKLGLTPSKVRKLLQRASRLHPEGGLR